MIRRPMLGMAVAFLLGIWTAAQGKAAPVVPVILFGTGLAAILLYRTRAKAGMVLRLLLLVVGMAAGILRYQSQQEFRMSYLAELSDGEEITVQGKLKQKECKNNQIIYYLSAPYMRAGRKGQESSRKTNDILVCFPSGEKPSGRIGEILVIQGTISLWKHGVNEGGFDEAAFYLAKKQDFKVENAAIRAVYGRYSPAGEWLYRLKQRLIKVYESSLKECGVLITMLLGDKTLFEAEVKALYQKAGILHITCISGLHFAILGTTFYQFLRKRRCGTVLAALAAGGMILCYGNMVGGGASVERAVGMFLLNLLAPVAGRTYDSLNALGLVAFLLLWKNPFLYQYAGFVFSCAAVAGVVWIGKSREKKEKLSVRLYQGLAVQLATLPFSAWYYYEIPVYGIFVNFLVLPFVKLLLLFGIAGGLAGLCSLTVAKYLLFPCHLILGSYLKICQLTMLLPGAVWITGRPAAFRMISYFVLLVSWNYLRLCHERASERREEQRKKGAQPEKERGKIRISAAGKNCICGLAFLLLLFLPSQKDFELTMLDVGQGDGSFIRTKSSQTIFIDGGSTSISKVGEYRLLPFLKYNGVRRIDYWFISHTDEDHISGLEELLQLHYPVKTLVFSELIQQEEVCLRLQELAGQNNTSLLFLKNQDKLHLGNCTVTAMLPETPAVSGQESAPVSSRDKNEESLVLLYEEEGFAALFTGDIGASREAGIKRLQPVDFYKAAHHGSDGSNTQEFLQSLSPTVTVISCAQKNSYGHPGKEAVERMEAVGSSLFYTMEAGQIRLTRKKNECYIEKYCAPREVYTFPLKYMEKAENFRERQEHLRGKKLRLPRFLCGILHNLDI